MTAPTPPAAPTQPVAPTPLAAPTLRPFDDPPSDLSPPALPFPPPLDLEGPSLFFVLDGAPTTVVVRARAGSHMFATQAVAVATATATGGRATTHVATVARLRATATRVPPPPGPLPTPSPVPAGAAVLFGGSASGGSGFAALTRWLLVLVPVLLLLSWQLRPGMRRAHVDDIGTPPG